MLPPTTTTTTTFRFETRESFRRRTRTSPLSRVSTVPSPPPRESPRRRQRRTTPLRRRLRLRRHHPLPRAPSGDDDGGQRMRGRVLGVVVRTAIAPRAPTARRHRRAATTARTPRTASSSSSSSSSSAASSASSSRCAVELVRRTERCACSTSILFAHTKTHTTTQHVYILFVHTKTTSMLNITILCAYTKKYYGPVRLYCLPIHEHLVALPTSILFAHTKLKARPPTPTIDADDARRRAVAALSRADAR